MNDKFFKHLFSRQQHKEAVPTNEAIADWATDLICLLFPELSQCKFSSVTEVEIAYKELDERLVSILNATKACWTCNNEQVSKDFFYQVPEMYRVLTTDIDSILNQDPAAKSEFEVIRAYPGLYTLSFFRIAHALLKLDVPLIPRILTEFAHSKTGIDIHPGAEIGECFHIDHGTGVVIGETAVIGKHVKIYQGVTLGALSVNKTMAYIKRHPTVEDHVVIYAGATLLGGETIIGHHSIIGGNVWLTSSVPPNSLVQHNPVITVAERKTINQ
jgi:serine O-acetyltransferase